MTVQVDTNTDRAEKLNAFLNKMTKEDNERTLQRHYRSKWCVELFDYSNGEIALPWSINYGDENITVDEPYRDENGDIDYDAGRIIDVDATKRKIAFITQFARSKSYAVTKKHTDDQFTVTVTLHQVGDEPSYKDIKFTYRASRQTVCKKVTKKMFVEEEIVPAHEEEVVEWECEKVSFMAMDLDSDDSIA